MESELKYCLLYESRRGGHFLRFVRLVAQAYLSRGWHVLLAGSPTVLNAPEIGLPPTVVRLPISDGPVLYKIWKLCRLSRRYNVRTLFIPFIDAFLPVLPLLYLFLPRSCLLSGIIFQANYAYPPAAMLERLKSALKRGLTFLYGKSGCVDRLYFLDPLAVRYWQTRGIWPFAFHSCPDPAQGRRIPRSRARKVLGLSPHLRIVASLGRQDERKGTMELIAAFAAGPGLLPDRRLVLAGEFSTGIRERLARLKEENPEVARRLIVIEGFLSDSELNLWANSADVMAVVHPAQIGSSGTLMMAALLEKPVLASDSGAIGTIAREYELGRLVRTSVPGDLVAGLEWAFSNPSIKKEAQKRLASEATEYAFKAAIAPKD